MDHLSAANASDRARPLVGSASRRRWLVSSALVPACGIAALMLAGGARADTLPTGGSVAAGTASIATTGTTTTITQSSQNAVINWSSFSVAQGHAVVFNDATAQGATLNRVTGTATSTIAGQITSNGSVYLINPNGIAITATGAVQTGGGFIASTLDIKDADFMAGRLAFTGNGASKSVTNGGRITAGKGAYVALLGGSVANAGTITVPLGKLAMGSGEQVALDLNGGNFMQVAVPTALVTGSSALVDNSGDIVVMGGAVQLSAAVVKNAVRNVVNMSGSINADSAVGNGGTISLIGGASTDAMAGNVTVSGSLSAKATGSTGDGGFVETSGEHVDLIGSTVSTLAAGGKAGTWLIDPVDFTVAATDGDQTGAGLSAALAGGNVTIRSNQGASGTNGDININDAVNWSANTLTLDAYRNINVNTVMDATGTAGFAGIVGDTAQNGTGSTGGALLMGLGNGFTGTLNLAPTSSFSLNGTAYTIVSALGAAGSTTGTDLQGINGGLTGNYVLGANIDASATAGWNSGAGFTSLGTDGAGNVQNGSNGFTGAFNGLGHTIAGLTINQPTDNLIGLFGFTSAGSSVGNVGMVGGSVSGSYLVGALVGNNAGGTITNAYATGTVSGGGEVGGLVGYNDSGTITNAYATGAVTSTGSHAGGLVGHNTSSNSTATITNAYATGTVSGGGNYVGGLVGENQSGTITDAYATGTVTGQGSVGGLVGKSSSTGNMITNAHATGAVLGNYNVGGLVGGNYGAVTSAYATGAVTGTGNDVGGLVGNNVGGTITSAYATGVVTSGGSDVAGLAGANYGAVTSAYATGAVSGGGYVGGLVGINSGTISNAYATGGVNTSGTYFSSNFGGLAGYNGPIGTITNAYATGAVTGNGRDVGGLVGNNLGSVTSAYATGVVSGGGDVGGLVGLNQGSVNNAYATGGVNSSGTYVDNNFGGLAGGNYGTISNAYATGAVTGSGSEVGGLVGLNQGSVTNAYWDSFSTGRSMGVGLGDATGMSEVTSNPTQRGAFNYAFNANAYSLSTTKWVLQNGVRPMGVWEKAPVVGGIATITNGHQLQLINATAATLSANYVLGGTIDLSETGANIGTPATSAGMWSGAGFVSIGTDGAGNFRPSSGGYGFTGAFDGMGHTITGLTLRQSPRFAGLFGYAAAGSSISNVGVVGGSVSGGNYVGGLVGLNGGGSITNAYATGAVTGSGIYVGGLIGFNVGTTTNVYATGAVTGVDYVGGLAGYAIRSSITNAYATGTVAGSGSNVGGLVGLNYGAIANVYATGAVTGGGSYVGGLVGSNKLGTIASAYATGAVTGGGSYVGGLVGSNKLGGTINSAYATGAVTGSGGGIGGLVGVNSGGIANAYWDSFSTGRSIGVGNGDASGVTEVTSDPMQSNAANYAFSASAYTLSIADWVFQNGVRPMGAWEEAPVVNGVATITNSHQLQLINASADTLSAHYVLGGNIDLRETGANIGTPATSAGMWSGAGFVSLGTDGAGNLLPSSNGTGFSGAFDGMGHMIAGLTIHQSSGYFTGLFGYTDAQSSIGNVGVVGGNVSGGYFVGGLAGENDGTITNAYFTGTVTGSGNDVGGLMGSNIGTTTNAYATGAVSGNANVGGVVGYNSGNITNAYATDAVTGSYNLGGFAGTNFGTIANVYASGAVTGSGGGIGGLVGVNFTAITNAYWDSFSTGQSIGVGNRTGGVSAVTSDPLKSSAANYAFNPNAYGNFSTTDWVFQNGVRPMGVWEEAPVVNGVATITNSHQLQLINASASTLAAHYVLGGNIDLGETGANMGTAATSSGMWGPTGFLSLGIDGVGGVSNGGNGFNGTFDGMGHTITGLTINRPIVDFAGLFGWAGPGSSIGNVGVVGVSVSGRYEIGGLVGYDDGGTVTNAFATGIVTSSGNYAGGLLGETRNATIANSYATATVSGGDDVGGLVGYVTRGTIINAYATGTVMGSGSYVGGLVGETVGSAITNAYATGAVTGSGRLVGGLVGRSDSNSTITNAYATGAVTGSTDYVGGLVGQNKNNSTITNAYATGAVSGSYRVGGLVGSNEGNSTITNDYATGTVMGSGNYVGGLVGFNNGGVITNAYVTGTVSGGSNYTGGLVGNNDNGGTITNAYFTGVVTGSGQYVGGLVGANDGTISNAYTTGAVSGRYGVGGLVGYNGGTISNAYATGSATTSSGSVGGLVGGNNGTITNVYATGMVSGSYNVGGLVGVNGGTIANAYWDSFSTGRTSGVGIGGVSGVTEITSDPAQSGAVNYAFNQQSYALFDPEDWVLMNGVRPMGVWEEAPVVNGVATITNSHQVQLINAAPYTLSSNYVLAGDIDLSETGANIGTPATSAGMWGPLGFVSIGTNGVGNSLPSSNGDGFTGTFDGMGHTIGGLTIQSGANVGLFGYTGAQSSISNVGIVGGLVTGSYGVGALVGRGYGTITNAYATGAVNGVSYVGGLVGYSDNAITNAYATVAVTAGGNYVGGLVGASNANGAITSAYATGVVSGSAYVGGLVGENVGTVTNAYATGSVSGFVGTGGLVGNNAGGTITNAYATGAVFGSYVVGGLVGYNGGTIAAGYWDTTTSGQGTGVGGGSSSGVTGLTDAQMLDLDHFAQNYAGFDFQNIWSPPNQVGQNDNSQTAFYPQLYALSNVIRVDGSAVTAVYGANVPGVSVNGIYGLHNGDVVTATPLLTAAIKGMANVGTYGLTSNGLAYHSVDNRLYRVVTSGNVTITPAPLMVTYIADAANSTYGTTPSSLTGSSAAVGLINGDMLGGNATWATSASGTDNVGTYAITGSGLTASSNYMLITVQAAGNASALSITPAALTVTYTAAAASSIYGTTPSGLSGTASSTGLVNGDILAGTANWTTGATGTSNVGNYAVTGAGLTASTNYMLTSVQAAGNINALSLTPAALTVTGNTTTATYNGNTITNGFTHGTLYGADTVTGVNGLASGTNANATPIADALSGATGSGLSNYTINYVNGSLAINPAALTVTYTATATSSVYGNTPSGLSGTTSSTGLVNGDTLGGTATWATLATGLSDVGNYAVAGAGLTASTNYTLTAVQAAGNTSALSITARPLTVTYTAATLNSIYGNTPSGLSGSTSATGLVNGNTLAGTAVWATSASGTSNVGNYAVAGAGLTASSNYTLTSVQAAANTNALSITARPLTVTYTANALGSVYGNTPSGLSGSTSSTGLVNGNTLAGTAVWTTGATGISDVGNYAVAGAGLTASSNYTLTSVQAAGNTNALSITARPLTVTYTAATLNSVFGNTPSGLSGSTSATGLVNGNTLSGTAVWATSASGTSNVGNYAVAGSGLTASSNYTLTSVQAVANTNALSITPRPLTVTYTTTALNSTYGNTPSGLSGTTSATGLINGNTLAGSAVWATSASGTSNVGNYAVAGSGLTASSNYMLTAVQAAGNANALSITPAPLTVTYTATALNSVYGNTPSGLSGSTSATGLVNGNTLAGTAVWTTGAAGTSNVGNYAVAGSGLTASNNYTLTAVQAAGNATALSITPAALTVTYTAAAMNSTYGNTPSGLSGSASATGLVNGNTLSGTAVWTTGATGISDVGNYAVAGAGLAASSNYTLTAVQAAGNTSALSITARPLTVTYTAATLNSIYGNTPSGLSGSTSATGLVNGNTLVGSASWATSASGTSDVGNYAVDGAGLTASSNYTLTAVQAAASTNALSITARPLTVTYTATAMSSTYGTTPSGLTGTTNSTGLVNNDSLSGTAAWATTATGTSSVGNYAITGSGLTASSNYTLTSVQAAGNTTALSITPKALTVTYTATAMSSTYGTTPSGLTGTTSSTGLVNNDSLSGTAAWATPATSTSNVGNYAITGSGLTASSNYTLSAAQASGNATVLSITPRPITVTANAQTNIYGSAVPTLTYGVGGMGLVNGNTLNGALATNATATSNAGTYAIAQATLGNSNYVITYTGANVTIAPAPLTLTYTANAVSVLFGQPFPTLSGTVAGSGFVAGQTLANLSGAASWTTPATAATFAGTYAVNGGGLSGSNYAITTVQAPGNATALTINPSGQSITDFVSSISDFVPSISATVQRQVSTLRQENEVVCASPAIANTLRQSGSASLSGRCSR